MPIVLVHGGLWGELDAHAFWTRTGVTEALAALGHAVHLPDRLSRPPDWRAEADHLADLVPHGPNAVVAGSNGCSAAVRLALAAPGKVGRLLLAWPATAGDPRADARAREGLRDADPDTAEALLRGETLRGVADRDLVVRPRTSTRSRPAHDAPDQIAETPKYNPVRGRSGNPARHAVDPPIPGRGSGPHH